MHNNFWVTQNNTSTRTSVRLSVRLHLIIIRQTGASHPMDTAGEEFHKT